MEGLHTFLISWPQVLYKNVAIYLILLNISILFIDQQKLIVGMMTKEGSIKIVHFCRGGGVFYESYSDYAIYFVLFFSTLGNGSDKLVFTNNDRERVYQKLWWGLKGEGLRGGWVKLCIILMTRYTANDRYCINMYNAPFLCELNFILFYDWPVDMQI